MNDEPTFFFRIGVTQRDFDTIRARHRAAEFTHAVEGIIAGWCAEARGDGLCQTCGGTKIYRHENSGPAERCPACNGTGRVA